MSAVCIIVGSLIGTWAMWKVLSEAFAEEDGVNEPSQTPKNVCPHCRSKEVVLKRQDNGCGDYYWVGKCLACAKGFPVFKR